MLSTPHDLSTAEAMLAGERSTRRSLPLHRDPVVDALGPNDLDREARPPPMASLEVMDERRSMVIFYPTVVRQRGVGRRAEAALHADLGPDKMLRISGPRDLRVAPARALRRCPPVVRSPSGSAKPRRRT